MEQRVPLSGAYSALSRWVAVCVAVAGVLDCALTTPLMFKVLPCNLLVASVHDVEHWHCCVLGCLLRTSRSCA